MAVKTSIVGNVADVTSIHVMVNGSMKSITQAYTFVENERHLLFPNSTLIYSNTTPGNYSFTIPSQYNFIKVVLAGACGGRSWNSDGAGIYPENSPGRGAIIEREFGNFSNRTITGVIGARPTMTYASEYLGGSGYHNGSNSGRQSVTIQYIAGGGGGGSTSVTVDGVTHEACGGGGRANITQLAPNTFGAKGGGQYGGAQQNNYANGNDATDPGLTGYNAGNGYIQIYGLAG